MYAIVEASGKQFRVEPGMLVDLDLIGDEVGTTITLDKVLVIGGDAAQVGAPYVAGASVQAKVIKHFQGEKKITFKYLHRRRFRRKVGYRAQYTQVEILSIQA
jgi:large subunit ribosomal protein L21